MMLMPSAGAVAQPIDQLGLFELDQPNANTTDDAAPGEDWNDVYACEVSPGVCSSYHFFSKTFIGASKEAPGNDVTFFTGGGSKDTKDIPLWAWSANDVAPDKDQILDAYGASYINPANWHPFVPPNTGKFGEFGWSGVLRGAGVIFFARFTL